MSALLETLWRASFQGALFIAAVWLICRLIPRLPAAVRCGLWWAACLKLLLGLVWVSPVELPVLPAAQSPAILSLEQSPDAGAEIVLAPGSEAKPSFDWKILLAAFWVSGLLAQLVLTLRQLRRTRRVIRRSEPVRAGWITAAFAELLERLGLVRSPELRASAEVDTPQAAGLVRPVVLLPDPGLERLSAQELSMTLCHELVHVRRKDLWLGWVPVLAQRIFFFHPLAALAAREYSLAREAACDAEVLRVLGSAPQAYGRLLLRWGVAPRETGLAAAGASPSLSNLKRRLQMLQHTSESTRRRSAWPWLAGAVALAGLIPFQIVAQDPPEPPEPPAAVEPAPEVPPAPPAPEVPPAPPVEPVEPGEPVAPVEAISDGVEGGVVGGVIGGVRGGVVGGVRGGVQGGVVGGVAGAPPLPRPAPAPRPAGVPVVAMAIAPPLPVVPMAIAPPPPLPAAAGRPAPAPRPAPGMAMMVQAPPPAPPKAPKPPKPPKAPKEKGYSYGWSQDGDSWILMSGKDRVTMSGSSDDLKRVKRLRGSEDEEILWFERDGKEYIVRDAATLAAVKELWKPVTELGSRQAKLGAEQAKLGGKQAELGGRQAELGAKQAALGAQMAALAAERVGRGDDADDAEIERKERELSRKMEELGRQQEELGRQQEQYSEPQEELGRRQEELGRQQEVASERAEKEMKNLMDRALRSGAAEEVR